MSQNNAFKAIEQAFGFYLLDHLFEAQFQWLSIEKARWTSLRKYLDSAPAAAAPEAAEAKLGGDDVEQARPLNDDELMRESFEVLAYSLSSSLIVSSTFEVLCLMTLTNCGGATSVMNLASREFAIIPRKN